MSNNAVALTGGFGLSTEGLIGGFNVSGGIVIEPNGQVTSVWSLSGVVGLGFSERSPHERSDMRVREFRGRPGCRFAHPGYATNSPYGRRYR
jgi:hypothetical protein